MRLRGAPELRARLQALKVAFKPIGRKWAETTVTVMRPQVPVKTGKGRSTVRVKNASMTRATVSAIYYMGILDKGAKAHTFGPRRAKMLRFEVGGRTVFAKRVTQRARAGMGFAGRAGREALRRNPMAATLIGQWNRAAR
jgi:hypothetical protein